MTCEKRLIASKHFCALSKFAGFNLFNRVHENKWFTMRQAGGNRVHKSASVSASEEWNLTLTLALALLSTLEFSIARAETVVV